jgi:transcriptional regulator of aromatic amino acid metabolism
VGIAHEILAVLATRRLNVVAVEVDPPHIYIDSPELHERMLDDLRAACLQVEGVTGLQVIDVMPGVRRRLHLDTMMAVMEDPVVAVDGQARLVVANAAASAVTGLPEASLCQLMLADILDEPGLQEELLQSGFHCPAVKSVCAANRFCWM